MPVTPQVLHPQHDAIGGGSGAPEDVFELPAHHQAHDLVLGQLGRGADSDEPAIAHDGDTVGEAQDLVDAVTHVDDRRTLAAEAPHEAEQSGDLLVGQRGRRLIQGEDADPDLSARMISTSWRWAGESSSPIRSGRSTPSKPYRRRS